MTLVAGAFLFGCEDNLTERPVHMPNIDLYLQELTGFDYVLNGIYSEARHEREGLPSGDNMPNALMLLGTDNMYSNRSASSGITQIVQDWDLKSVPTNSRFESIFEWLYKIVNNCNTVIDYSENPGIDWQGDGNKERVVAEARTMRAWAYRHLTYLWGDVPLQLHKLDKVVTDFVREPRSKILDQMIKDLLYGAQYLPIEPHVEGRVCRGVAMTYLAETYLAVGNPTEALYWADECLKIDKYKLVTARYGVKKDKPGTPFSDMFLSGNSNRSEGNTESLWTMQWERLANGGQVGSGNGNIMRRVYAPFYDNSDDKFRAYNSYAGGTSTLTATVERGGKSLGHGSLTPYALWVYASSSDDPTDMDKFDDRVKEHSMRLFFVMDKADNYDENIINTGTGNPWKKGDYLWCATYDHRKCPGDKNNSLVRDLNLFNTLTSIKYDFKGSETPGDKMLTQTATWPYSLKYTYVDPAAKANERGQWNDQVYMRLAETYLLKAEAQCRLNDKVGAATTINFLRDRAHAKQVSAADIDLDFILDERSRELLMEEHRRYTLLRFGGETYYNRVKKYNFDLEGCKNFTKRDTLFPIPQSVIDANIDLPMKNNPGW